MTTVPGFEPAWGAPTGVRAFITDRRGGRSARPFDGFNTAGHVGDDPEAVVANRARLREGLALPAEPAWLHQVHGTVVTPVTVAGPATQEADAAYVSEPGAVAVVQTADCLPVLLARGDGRAAGVAHCGWRSLAGGVLAKLVQALGDPDRQQAYLGPAIGPAAFRVGADVRAAFDGSADEAAFRADGDGYRADLYHLARNRLIAAGLNEEAIRGGGFCTYTDAERFFSHRRDGRTGRMAALIWLTGSHAKGGKR